MFTRRQLLESGAIGGAGLLVGRAPLAAAAAPARQDVPVTIEWRNHLERAFLPNDPTLMGAVMPGEAVPMVPHLHGGENLPQHDGTPLQWFTKDLARRGPYFIDNVALYTNEQRAAMIWYH